MNRLEEFNQLKNKQHDIPSSLDDLINQQVKHYYQYQKRKRYIYYPIISLCSIIFVCILTFNLFPHTAYACKDIPLLEDFAKTFCFNQTVKDCIENDYAIYVNHTDKDITLEYMIIDETQITFYLKICQSDFLKDIQFIQKGEDYSQALLYGDNFVKIQCMYNNLDNIEFNDYLSFTLNQQHYQFPLNIDKSKIKKTKSIILNKDIIIHNQKITIQKLEMSPTVTKIYIQSDPHNTLLFDDAYVVIKKNGSLYTNATGISAQQIQNNTKVLMIESPYFKGDYTLSFQRFSFISPDYDHCLIDVQKKTIHNLPKDMQIDSFQIKDNQIKIKLSTENPYTSYCFVNQYYDNHKKIDFNQTNFGMTEKDGKTFNYQIITIPYQKDHQYELDIDYKQTYNYSENIDIQE